MWLTHHSLLYSTSNFLFRDPPLIPQTCNRLRKRKCNTSKDTVSSASPRTKRVRITSHTPSVSDVTPLPITKPSLRNHGDPTPPIVLPQEDEETRDISTFY